MQRLMDGSPYLNNCVRSSTTQQGPAPRRVMPAAQAWHFLEPVDSAGSGVRPMRWLPAIALCLMLAGTTRAGDASVEWTGHARLTPDHEALRDHGLGLHLRGFSAEAIDADERRSRVAVSSDWHVRVDEHGYPTASGSFDLSGAALVQTRRGRVVVGNLRFTAEGGVWAVADTLGGDGPTRSIGFIPRSTAFRAATGRYRLEGDLTFDESWSKDLDLPRGVTLTWARVVVMLQRHRPGGESGLTPDTASRLETLEGGVAGTIGPDVIVGDLYQVNNYGVVDDTAVLSVGTISCNVGDEPILWIATTNEHPVIAQNMYRLKSGRFEQVGMSWLKHGFFAVSGGLCFSDCEGTDGSALGVHCSDPYSANLNGTQGSLGPRSEVNAYTGAFPYPPGGPAYSGLAARRLQVHVDDLDQSLNAGASYFVESQYVTPDESAAGNHDNNNSYRPVTVSGAGSAVTVSLDGVTRRTKPAIKAWRNNDPAVVEQSVRVPDEGLFILAGEARDLGDGYWSYEYAVQNINSHRSAGWFRVPVAPTANVRNIGFHDVDYHSGEPFDGSDWSVSRSSVALTWSTAPFDTWPDANALRWGSLYNFRFEADVPPETSTATIGLFRPGTPDRVEVTMTGPVTNASDCNGNDVADSTDIVDGTSADCNANLIPDECETHRPMAVPIATGAADPVAVTGAPGDAELIYVAQRDGLVRVVESGALLPTPFLDLTAAVSTGPEQGLLDLAFHPDFASNGRFFVSYVDLTGSTVIAEFNASASRYEADPLSETKLKTIAQPFADGNGGGLAVDGDGYLFVAMGDGGSLDDPLNRGQEPGTLLGKVLRLDADDPPFYVPDSNPFVGAVLPVDEIWSLGVQRPQGLFVDAVTTDLYLADRGPASRGELNIEPGTSPGGRNYGWRCMEGTDCTGLTGCTCNDPKLTLPDVTLSGSGEGCGIIGGPAYRGCALTDWLGVAFYADTCDATFYALRYEDGAVVEETDVTGMIEAATGPITDLVAFGEDVDGEVLMVSASGTIYRWISNPAVCGNETVEPGESCDDGNTLTGDGCAPDCTLEPAASNDVCDAAIDIGEGVWSFTTVNAGKDGPDEPALCDVNGETGLGHDVWYRYTPSCDGTATINTCTSNFDTRLAVYTGATCPTQSSTALACNDNGCSVGSALSVDVEACAPYLVRVGGSSGETGSGSLSVQCDPEPLVEDCNGNLVSDHVDIACQTSTDGNGNGVPDECETDGDPVLGGRLYDNWWTELGLAEPVLDHPLWAFRPDPVSNTRTGADTWRCKECHGWDYKGVDGQYGAGPHRTGIPGILGTTLGAAGLFDLLKEPPSNGGGAGIPDGHDFGTVLPDIHINDLVAFVLSGAIDDDAYINKVTGEFIGDAVTGEELYQFGGSPACAVCHGADGATINFGTPESPVYVGTIAVDNPWELMHKIRFGQPAAPMPSWLDGGGTDQGATDIGRYAQESLVNARWTRIATTVSTARSTCVIPTDCASSCPTTSRAAATGCSATVRSDASRTWAAPAWAARAPGRAASSRAAPARRRRPPPPGPAIWRSRCHRRGTTLRSPSSCARRAAPARGTSAWWAVRIRRPRWCRTAISRRCSPRTSGASCTCMAPRSYRS